MIEHRLGDFEALGRELLATELARQTAARGTRKFQAPRFRPTQLDQYHRRVDERTIRFAIMTVETRATWKVAAESACGNGTKITIPSRIMTVDS